MLGEYQHPWIPNLPRDRLLYQRTAVASYPETARPCLQHWATVLSPVYIAGCSYSTAKAAKQNAPG